LKAEKSLKANALLNQKALYDPPFGIAYRKIRRLLILKILEIVWNH